MTTKTRSPQEDAADAANRSLNFFGRVGTPAQRAAGEKLQKKIAEWTAEETGGVAMSRRPRRAKPAKKSL